MVHEMSCFMVESVQIPFRGNIMFNIIMEWCINYHNSGHVSISGNMPIPGFPMFRKCKNS